MNQDKKSDVIGLLRYYGVYELDIMGIINRLEEILDE